MVLIARLLSRLVGTLLLAALALAGLAAAVFCIQSGHGTLSLPRLAHYLHLALVRRSVGTELERLRAHGPVAVISALCGAGAVVLGLILMIGVLVPARERLVVLGVEDGNRLSARRRAIAAMARMLAERPREVMRARVRVRPRRRGTGGVLRVRVRYAQAAGADGPQARRQRQRVQSAVGGSLGELTDGLPLRTRLRLKPAEKRVS